MFCLYHLENQSRVGWSLFEIFRQFVPHLSCMVVKIIFQLISTRNVITDNKSYFPVKFFINIFYFCKPACLKPFRNVKTLKGSTKTKR